MDPQATDTNAAKTPPVVLEYQPVQRRRSRLTGWDWSLIVAVPGLVVIREMAACAGAVGAVNGRAAMWLCMPLIARMLVGVVMRDRSRWWVLYLSLYCAVPWIIDAMGRYGGAFG